MAAALGVGFWIGAISDALFMALWIFAYWHPYSAVVYMIAFSPALLEALIGGIWCAFDFARARRTGNDRLRHGTLIGFCLCTWIVPFIAIDVLVHYYSSGDSNHLSPTHSAPGGEFSRRPVTINP